MNTLHHGYSIMRSVPRTIRNRCTPGTAVDLFTSGITIMSLARLCNRVSPFLVDSESSGSELFSKRGDGPLGALLPLRAAHLLPSPGLRDEGEAQQAGDERARR
jgi:hypothetical protein